MRGAQGERRDLAQVRRRPRRVVAFLSMPVDTRLLSHTLPPPIPCSLGYNYIGFKGASALAAVLKKTKITHLKCECLLSCPLTHLRTRSFLALHVPILASEAYVILGPFPGTFLLSPKHFLHSLANAHTRPFPTFPSTRCCPPSCATWTEVMSYCRTDGSRVFLHLLTPL